MNHYTVLALFKPINAHRNPAKRLSRFVIDHRLTTIAQATCCRLQLCTIVLLIALSADVLGFDTDFQTKVKQEEGTTPADDAYRRGGLTWKGGFRY